jgi:hypothetical protein
MSPFHFAPKISGRSKQTFRRAHSRNASERDHIVVGRLRYDPTRRRKLVPRAQTGPSTCSLAEVAARQARKDRRKRRRPRGLHGLPNGRGRCAARSVSPHPRLHRWITTMRRRPMLRLERLSLPHATGGGRPKCPAVAIMGRDGLAGPAHQSFTGPLRLRKRSNDSHEARKGAKSPQDGGYGPCIWEMSGQSPSPETDGRPSCER